MAQINYAVTGNSASQGFSLTYQIASKSYAFVFFSNSRHYIFGYTTVWQTQNHMFVL